MLRALLATVLAVSAAACNHSEDGPKVVAGAAAGKVVDVAGSVRATRDGAAPRTLVAGDAVSGDDVIETGADGRVAIELAHNGARWELGAGKRQRVSESLAWGLPKQEGAAGVVDQATSAAGRHAERSAAETSATAGAAAPTPAPVAAAPAAAAAAAPARDRERDKEIEAAADKLMTEDHATRGAKQAAPSDERRPAADLGREIRDPRDAQKPNPGTGRSNLSGPSEPPPPPPAAQPPANAIRALLEADRDELRKCLTDAAPHLTLTLHVAHGAGAIELAGGAPSAQTRACLDAAVKHLALGALDGDGSIELVK